MIIGTSSLAREEMRLYCPQLSERLAQLIVLLFLGYRLHDWNFRVLFRILAEYIGRSRRKRHVIVMLPVVDSSDESGYRAREFYDRYSRNYGMKIYWGTIREFAAELKNRLESM